MLKVRCAAPAELTYVCAGLLAALVTLITGCGRGDQAATSIKLATTTSTENSGLLDVLAPALLERHGIELQIIAVGTGKAIKHGENGDVDVILVHDRTAEDRFVADGFGVGRRGVMHNDFVILGPKEDPAAVNGMKDAAAALVAIARAKGTFVSRGDDSGTHRKEKGLWKTAGVVPSGPWYLAAGQGMGACLTIANERRAYIISDRGTYLAYHGKIDLTVLLEGDPKLINTYGVIAVNPEKHPHVKYEATKTFIEWLTGPEARDIITSYRRGGKQLFYPDAR